VDCDLDRPARPARPPPIRDAILHFVTQPRAASEIAQYIERPVPTTTGHLRAMIRLGLVRRIAFGTYAPGGYTGPTIRLPQTQSESSGALRAQLVSLLHERSSVHSLRLKTGAPEQTVLGALRDLWLSGLIAGNEKEGFWLVRWKQKNI
jgi:hypothetical protein